MLSLRVICSVWELQSCTQATGGISLYLVGICLWSVFFSYSVFLTYILSLVKGLGPFFFPLLQH